MFPAGRRKQQASGLFHPARGTRGFLCALLGVVAVLVGFAASVWADEKAAAPVRGSETVIVPYDAKKPLAGQKPDQFYLPYERFLELWEAAKKNRTGAQMEPAAVAYVLSAARYEGVVGERSVAFTGKLDVTTYNDAWVKVPLAFKDVQIGALKIDGVTAAFDGAEVIVEKPGRHAVEVTFEIPLARGAKTLEWGIPRTGATLVMLTLPDGRTRAKIAPGSGVIERVADGKNIVTAAVGTTDRVRVELLAAAGVARVTEPAVAAIKSQVTVMNGLEETGARFVFSFPGARQDRFTVYLEKGLTPFSLEAANVKSWRLVEEGGRQVLEVTLNEPAEEQYDFGVGCERALAALPAERVVPVFSAAAKRLDFTASALFANARIEVVAKPDGALRQVTWEGGAVAGARLIGAYAGAGKLAYSVKAAEAQREARVDYAYQVNRRKIELIASLQLFAKGDDLLAVTVALPAQFEVQAVQSERLQDWWREGDTLHLRFKGATPEMTPLVVYLVRQYATAPTELDVQPLTLDGFKKVSGEAVIAAHKGVEVKMKLSADGSEVAPERAATDFQILPPLERKRGFTFKEQKFAAQVALAALPAKTNVLWVMHALAHEGWVGVSMHAQLTMRQGSIDRASFALPASVPEARVTGGEVRETRSRVEGDRRVYEVQFQNDVYEDVEFTADLELPNPAEVALPSVAFPEAQMTSGFVLTDNASEFEMKLKTTGTDPAPVSEIPFLPELSKAAGIYRVQPVWRVTVGVERLEKTATRAAFVAWAEMTTALRRDGTEWHRATYRLQNRSLQFLPVKMPAGAELMSVRVAGQSVRADAGQVNGQAAILVPLIKTKPGDLSYDVELVWRLQRAALGWRTTQDFRDPELLGITVERTLWNVWLPDDRRLSKSDGNMEAVLGDLNKVEKIEGKRQEQKALFSILSSSNASAATRQNAKSNWGILQKEIEAENRDENFAETNGFFSRRGGPEKPKPTPVEESVGKKGIAQQGDYVANKRKAVNEELAQEARKVAELEKQDYPFVSPGGTPVGANPITAGNRSGQQAISANAIDALLFGTAGSSALNGNNNVIVLPTPPNDPANDPNNNRQAHPTQNWSANGGYAQQKQAATPAPANAEGVGNNLYLNDNIVLQQRVTAEKPAAPGKGAANAPVAAADASIASLKSMEAKRGAEEAEVRQLKAATGEKMPDAQESAGTNEKDVVFNTARGNQTRFKQQQLEQQPAQMQQQVGIANGAVPALPQSAPAVVGGQAFGGGAGAGGFQQGMNAAEEDARRMQTAGRISLAVDFPTEGQVIHFKKVKANARLSLTTHTPETWVRWQYLVAALGLGGVLLIARRLVERRGLRSTAGL